MRREQLCSLLGVAGPHSVEDRAVLGPGGVAGRGGADLDPARALESGEGVGDGVRDERVAPEGREVEVREEDDELLRAAE